MSPFSNSLLTLIDPSLERQREVAGTLGTLFRHVEPHTELERALRAWPLVGLVAVADTASLVADLQHAMRTRVLWRPHVVFGEGPTPARIADAIIGGATDFLAWPFEADELHQRIVAWRARSANVARWEKKKRRARGLLARLSKRETEVLNLMAKGRTSAQIATALDLAAKTVEVHRANLLQKLGVGGSVMAVRLVLEAAD